ncbi:MAG: GTP pyrophosphokinase, partial [Halothiobacillaceae bacterium]
MVTVTHPAAAITGKFESDCEAWLATLKEGYDATELALLHHAYQRARQAHEGEVRLSGESLFEHVLAVANILVALRADSEVITAALLHEMVATAKLPLTQVESEFNTTVAMLIDGVTKMDTIQFTAPELEHRVSLNTETLRKMLLAMVDDVRVVLIKLADALHNLRTLNSLSEERRIHIARETLEIYAPLANRLGIWQIKWEMEDLSFRYLEPERYKKIAGYLNERRITRQDYIESFLKELRDALMAAGIDAEVSGRPKHIYSIYRKMQRKQLDYHQIYDVRAARIIVNEERDCYAALGVVHGRWRYIPGEFDDYIANPKVNNYRSIHTALIGPEGKTVEVQIRTRGMHQYSELGVAAHWRYKENVGPNAGFERKIAWLRQLLEWKDEVRDASELADNYKNGAFDDRVYVFTPKGQVIDLPTGSTPLDFAYHIHSELGHRCRGAKINGHIVPLIHELKTGEQVEVLAV